MLVAQNDEGKLLSLSSLNLQKEELLEIRQRKKFFCPVCYEEVIIKLGTKQAWHFAHKRKLSCTDEMEGETTYHIEGKKLLFNWLINQELDVELEPYLKEVKQRPDLLVRTPQKSFAIEFQCAQISPETFIKRTRTYQDFGYFPFWILGGNQLKRQFHNAYRLSSFQWLFSTNLTSSLKQSPQIVSFCPQNKTFIFLKNITAISATISLTTPTIQSINRCSFEDFYQPYKEVFQLETWLHTKRLWRTPRAHLSLSQHYLRKLYLNRGQPLWLFPSEAGVPTCFHYFIETPTYVWQSWLLEIFVTNKRKGEKFHIALVKRAFKTLVNKGVFKLRILPLLDSMSFYMAIEHYVKFLCHIQVLTTKDSEVFVKNLEISHEKTLEQAFTKDQQVIRNYIEFNK